MINKFEYIDGDKVEYTPPSRCFDALLMRYAAARHIDEGQAFDEVNSMDLGELQDAVARAEAACLMDDGFHEPAVPGQDLCQPCQDQIDAVQD